MVLCAAYGCNTDSKVHRISMFGFPKKENDNLRRQAWINRLNRGQSATKKFAPTQHSKLCAKHFEEDQFRRSKSFAEEIGFKDFRLHLKPDAVPTIFENPNQKKASKERPSAAAIFDKRLKNEVCEMVFISITYKLVIRNIIIFKSPAFYSLRSRNLISGVDLDKSGFIMDKISPIPQPRKC